MNFIVGNLSYDLSEEDLKKGFEEFGQVESAKIITDSYSGTSKTLGYVEMSDEAEAQSAIDGLIGKSLKGRRLYFLLIY